MNDWTKAEVNDWTKAEINALMAERDAAIRERDKAETLVGDMRDLTASAIRERDEALAILQAFIDADAAVKASATTSFFEYVDAMDRARKLLGGV